VAETLGSATRSAYLELRDERQLVHEGYEFLDEKRTLLAARLIELLDRYQSMQRDFREQYATAIAALAGAIGRHGLDGLSVYPPLDADPAKLTTSRGRFLGIELLDFALATEQMAEAGRAVLTSPEVRACVARYRDLLGDLAAIAGVERSLRRLEREFVRTDRRAKALENVLLPEIDATLKQMDEQLEGVQLEEGIRMLHAARGRGG
jgi:V/A-type H+-transporting ATPase subunit D